MVNRTPIRWVQLCVLLMGLLAAGATGAEDAEPVPFVLSPNAELVAKSLDFGPEEAWTFEGGAMGFDENEGVLPGFVVCADLPDDGPSGYTLNPFNLGCGCNVMWEFAGVAGSPMYASKLLCETKAPKDNVYRDALVMTSQSCHSNYTCVDPENCPELSMIPDAQENACRCSEIKEGPNSGKWTYDCDLFRSKCCCEPEL